MDDGGSTQIVSPPRFTDKNSEFVTPSRVDPLARLQGSDVGPRTAAPADNAQETNKKHNLTNVQIPAFPFPARESSGSFPQPSTNVGAVRSESPCAPLEGRSEEPFDDSDCNWKWEWEAGGPQPHRDKSQKPPWSACITENIKRKDPRFHAPEAEEAVLDRVQKA